MLKNVRFRLNKAVETIIKDCGVNDDTLRFAVSETRGLMSEFVPMDTGRLVNSASESLENGAGRVTYDAPYARFCYYGEKLRFRRDKNFKACAFWDRAMMQVYGGVLYARVEKFIKKR